MTVRNGTRLAVVLAIAVMMLTAVATGSATNAGKQGCTPGFWKQNPGQWQGYTPTQKVSSVFSAAPAPYANWTLMDALQGGGGPGVGGATQILLRASVAAFLNAEHEGVGYPYRRYADPGRMHYYIQAALRSGNRDQMLVLADVLDKANNLGCPLKADEATKKKTK
jgi:hypothetical protein